MRVHYDNIVFSLQRAGGISTYWSELIMRLLRDGVDVSFDECKHQNIVRNTLAINAAALRNRGSKYLLLERFKALKLPEQNQPFVFHSSYNRITNNKNAAQVTTVHDFVHEKFYKGIRRSLHLMQKGKVLRAAERIITVSENTKRDLMQFHPGITESKVRVIYNGVSEDFYPLDPTTKLGLLEVGKRPYLLYIGSREHYKNFRFTVDLLKESPDFDLYIVGSALLKTELQYVNQQVPGRWKHFDHISNQRLNELYNTAFALIYPSFYEGFGIPLLEAMKAGVPFLALNNSAIPEVAGHAGIVLERADIGLFKEALDTLSSNRSALIEKGYIQAARFSWEKCYQETLSVYKELN
jgi:mannosyltransferase